MLFVFFVSLLGVDAEECQCTGMNEGLPESSPHWGTSFGKECKPWDNQYDICKEEDAPAWCTQKWCYVQEGCTIDDAVDAKESTYKDSGLYYSYKVCGSIDFFDNNNFEYEFKGCGEERGEPLDVYFAVDSSTSVDPLEFQQQMTFLSKLVRLGLTVDGDRAGMITWSDRLNLVYRLGDPNNLEELAGDAVNNVGWLGGVKMTAEAIQFGIDRLIEESDGNRKVLILITDDLPTGGSDPCDGELKRRKFKKNMTDLGITFGIIGIGGDIDFGQLNCLVEDPKENIVVMQDFNSFYEYQDPTGNENLICIDPTRFKEPENVVDNSCGCRCKFTGQGSKKKKLGRKTVLTVFGGSCACQMYCEGEGARAFSFRSAKDFDKHMVKKGRILKNCVCFAEIGDVKIIPEREGKKVKGRQLLGYVNRD